MAHRYRVYQERYEHEAMTLLLESPAPEIISITYFLLGAAGVVVNAMMLTVFLKIYSTWRFPTRLWVNLCLCLMLSSFAICLRAVSDYVDTLSGTALLCSLRVFIPTAIDISCYGCLLVMLFDRLTVVHFPNLYIYNEENNNCKILYGWLFGITFFIFKMFVIEQFPSLDRCTSPYSVAYPLESVSLFTALGLLLLLLMTLLGYVFTPVVTVELQVNWIETELEETVRVLIMSGLTLALWAPKHVYAIHHLIHGTEEFTYQVFTVFLFLPTRIVPLLPLLVFLRRENFREALWCTLTCHPDAQVIGQLVSAKEANADVVFRTVVLTVYPNHPALTKGRTSAAPSEKNKPGHASSVPLSSNRKTRTVSNMSFEPHLSKSFQGESCVDPPGFGFPSQKRKSFDAQANNGPIRRSS